MNQMFEKVSKAVDEIGDKNLTMDMAEGKIAELIYGEGPFVASITRACPTSFMWCC